MPIQADVGYWHFSDLTHPVDDVRWQEKSRSSRRAVKVTRLTDPTTTSEP